MGEGARVDLKQSYAAITMPEFLPTTRDLLADASDHVWVQHYPRSRRAGAGGSDISVDETLDERLATATFDQFGARVRTPA